MVRESVGSHLNRSERWSLLSRRRCGAMVQPYLGNGRLCEYLADRSISYIVDNDHGLTRAQDEDPRIGFGRPTSLSSLYDPSGATVDEVQYLVRIDTSGCGA